MFNVRVGRLKLVYFNKKDNITYIGDGFKFIKASRPLRRFANFNEGEGRSILVKK